MEKQKICAISNREDNICYTLDKNKYYYDFLIRLLEKFDIKNIPDFYDETGQLPDATKDVDSTFFWESNTIHIIHVIGYNKIFLFVRTDLRDKLNEFIEENCEFVNKR